MTQLNAPAVPIPGWTGGLVQDAEPGSVGIGTIAEGENFVPTASGLQKTRGGSRLMLTLKDDQGTPAELTHVCLLKPFTPVGVVAIGWSDTQNKHYAHRLTSEIDFFTGVEATSRVSLTAAPSASWNNGSSPARPVAAELFEKLFIADATASYASRNELLSLDSAGTVLNPLFSFDGGAAESLRPYCLEEYNGVLFIAGYGDGGAEDRPEVVRHSLLATSPDAATGFDKNAYVLLGAKGQRVTAMRKGRGLLLCAKEHELYRITGFGRAYPGWQYQVDTVQQTLGLGISNPHGLTFAEGYWYGVGPQGPLRTDGFNVESLAGPRQRGWRAINKPENAFVTYHPERRLILFGLHPTQTSGSRSATYPWLLWTWDIEREVWQTDWKMGADFFMATPVSVTVGSSASIGPSAPPSAPNNSAIGTGGYTANWTNGDATAETEVWEKEGAGGTWTLVTTVAAAVASYARTGRSNHTEYYWKVRHRKSGVTTVYTTELSVKIAIVAPSVGGTPLGFASLYDLTIGQNAPGTDLRVEWSDIGAGVWNHYTTISAAATSQTITVPGVRDYRARSEDAAWTPTTSAYSATETLP